MLMINIRHWHKQQPCWPNSCIVIIPSVFWMLSQILHCPPKVESVCHGRWMWCSVDWSTAVSPRPPCGTAWPRVGGENVACHCYSAYAGLSERWSTLCQFLFLSSPAYAGVLKRRHRLRCIIKYGNVNRFSNEILIKLIIIRPLFFLLSG